MKGTTSPWSIKFDTSETWSTNRLRAMAIHEAGHLIGLDHSSRGPSGPNGIVKGAVMWPYIGGSGPLTQQLLDLNEEDIVASSALTNTWHELPGDGVDIGVSNGATEQMWILGLDSAPGGFAVYRWTGSAFEKKAGGGVRIDVGPNGDPWVITNTNDIKHWTGENQWETMPGKGKDVGVGGNGTAYVIGLNDVPWRYDAASKTFVEVPGITARAIDVSPSGTPIVVTTDFKIFERQGNQWVALNRNGYDVGAGGHVDQFSTYEYLWAAGSQNIPSLFVRQPAFSDGTVEAPVALGWLNVQGPNVAAGPIEFRVSAGRSGRGYLIDNQRNVWERRMD